LTKLYSRVSRLIKQGRFKRRIVFIQLYSKLSPNILMLTITWAYWP
jgi:hypothetical protein